MKKKRAYFPNPNFFSCPPIICDSTDPDGAENTREIYSGMFSKGADPIWQTATDVMIPHKKKRYPLKSKLFGNVRTDVWMYVQTYK